MLGCMSQHESSHQPSYSFGRDRYRGDAQQQARNQAGAEPHGVHQGGSGMVHPQAQTASGQMIPPPPPPAGHRNLFVVVLLYLVTGFMLVFTGAGVGATVEAATVQGGTDLLVNVFMTVASLAIVAILAGWLIRIHRRRAGYRRILDDHYAHRFGHHPDRR